ncbi:MAG: hypothetical protein U0790_05345 [Isosphaeraceae bacterium]
MNKNELLLVLDFDEGTTLERTTVVREIESALARVPEVIDFTSWLPRDREPDRFQRAGPPLLPAADAPPGGGPGQPGR